MHIAHVPDQAAGRITLMTKDGDISLENDYWFVSYDNGANWTQLGKATGEDGIGECHLIESVIGSDIEIAEWILRLQNPLFCFQGKGAFGSRNAPQA